MPGSPPVARRAGLRLGGLRLGGLRLGGIAAVAGLLTLLWAPAAQAAPALTIPLDPPVVLVAPYPVENFGPLTLAGLQGDTYAPVLVQWGGTVVLDLPSTLDAGAVDVTLGLAPTDVDPAAVDFSTEHSPPDLTIAPGPPGDVSITMPPADPVNPIGYLSIDGLAAAPGIDGVDVMPAEYLLEFDASYPASQTLAPDVFAVAAAPCSASSGSCPDRRITAGQSFALTVPASSALRQLGLGSFDDVQMTLQPVAGAGAIELAAAAAGAAGAADTGAEPPLSPVVEALGEATAEASDDAAALDLTTSGVSAAASSFSATATVPASAAAGPYVLTVLESGTSGGASMTLLDLDVVAPQVVNAGLRSDTGWPDAFALRSSPGAPLVAIGGGLLLIAGLGTVAALPGRRTSAR